MPVTDLALREVGIRLPVHFSVGIFCQLDLGSGTANIRRCESFGRGRSLRRPTVDFSGCTPRSNLDSVHLAICGEFRAGVRVLGPNLFIHGNMLVIECI